MGGAAVQKCPNQPEDICAKLAREITEMLERAKGAASGGGTKGLKQRFQEQIEGVNGPPGSGAGDPEVWNRHDTVIKEQQKGLRDRLNDYNKNNCGDKIPIPSDAWEWATKPAPKAQQWTGPVHAFEAVPQESPGFMKKMSELTGLTGVGLLIYVIISEGSRAFPPRNLVPVP